jgi:hypothetical protein
MTRDPLHQFFARERDEVRELPAGEERWQELLEESRRPRHRHAVVWLGAAAAAAVVAAGLLLGTGHGPGLQQAADRPTTTTSSSTAPRPTVTVTRTVTAGPAPATGSAPGRGPASATESATTASPPKVLPVPASFGMVSMTNAGGGHLLALGSASCPSGACTAVVASDDDGRTWTTRSSLTDLTTMGPLYTPATSGQLVGVRFATPEVGYVYGGQVRRTTDGGRSWAPVDVGGRRVLSLEIGGGTAWMVTAEQCRHGAAVADRGCTGLEVWSSPVAGTRASKVEAMDLPSPVESAWVSMAGADAYVSVAYSDRDTQTLPRRVSGARATVSRPQGCPDIGGVWLWGSAQGRGSLVVVCQLHDAKDSYGVATSGDGGTTWSSARIAPGLGPVTPSGVWVTAVDRQQLVAVTRGLPTSGVDDQPTALVVSRVGGSSWSTPRGIDNSRGWSWTGAAGGRLVYALASGDAGYSLSTDGGSTFETVPLRR